MKIEKILNLLLLPVLLSACNPAGRQEVRSGDSVDTIVTIRTSFFHLPDIPVMLTDPEERLVYLANHYWDCIPPSGTAPLQHQPEMEQAWADYCDLLRHISLPQAQKAIKSLFPTLEGEMKIYVQFKSLAEKYLDDPNSPYRNEELYIPVLESMTESASLSNLDKLRPRERLRLALRNRVGTCATDFTFIDAKGHMGTLYRTVATDYTLLFFNEPGCPSCAASLEVLNASSVVNSLIEKHRLTILAIYAGEETEQWQCHTKDFPSTWLNGYDKTGAMYSEQLYDLRATPSLYLLDRSRKVLLKDATAEEVLALLEKHSLL